MKAELRKSLGDNVFSGGGVSRVVGRVFALDPVREFDAADSWGYGGRTQADRHAAGKTPA